MIQLSIHIDRLRHFSADGQVYRAFHMLIVARMGALLLVPIHLVSGRCDTVVDGCPVPWEEVYAVLNYADAEHIHSPLDEKVLHQLELIDLDPDDCFIDKISPMVHGRESVLRLVHPSGIRFAVVIG